MMYDCKQIEDKELVAKIIADPDFYACVVQEYEAKLGRYVRRLTNVHPDEIDDILQEIFIKAYQNINNYDSDYKFSSWLYRIAHNETISHWRKYKKSSNDIQLDVSEDFVKTLKDDTDLNAEVDTKFTRDYVQSAIAKLPFKYREVIVLRYLEDKDYQEIGDIIKKPVNTVGTLLNRAKKKLADLI